MTCTALVTKFASGPCSVCGARVGDGVEMHFVENGVTVALYCAEHCVCCHAKEWEGAPENLIGVQEDLW